MGSEKKMSSSEKLTDVRCPNCNRLLLRAAGHFILEIKCPRCHAVLSVTVKPVLLVELSTDTSLTQVTVTG